MKDLILVLTMFAWILIGGYELAELFMNLRERKFWRQLLTFVQVLLAGYIAYSLAAMGER